MSSSGIHTSSNIGTLKTRGMIWQNGDGSFPAPNSVLQIADNQGTVVCSSDLVLDSLQINNDNLTIDASGNMVVNSLALTGSGSDFVAVSTNGGNIEITDANLIVTGNQTTTGYVKTAALELTDPVQSNASTYLWVNNSQLLWQPEAISGQTINISQGLLNLVVDPSGYDLVLPTDPNDNVGIYNALVTLLRIFNKRSIFIGISGETPIPPPVVPPNAKSPLTMFFNSPCTVTIVIQDINTQAVLDRFVYSATPNSQTKAQAFLVDFFVGMNNSTSPGTGHALTDYVTFSYAVSGTAGYTFVTCTDANPTYTISFCDTNYIGEAQRFMNQIRISTTTYPFPPLFYSSVYQLYPNENPLVYSFPTRKSFVGIPLAGGKLYFNNDAPLPGPTDVTVSISVVATILIEIHTPPNTSGLSADNAIVGYGITFNGTNIYNKPVTHYPIQFSINYADFDTSGGTITIRIFTIDRYNQSLVPSVFVLSAQ